MTTPGSVRTKLWRSGNKKRYSDYQREYMKKYREKLKQSAPNDAKPDEVTTPPQVPT
jgi:hypothetical protein